MALTVLVIKETAPHEARVSATADTVKKMAALGITVLVESGAGITAAIADETYIAAGAKIVKDAATGLKDADIVLCVQRPASAVLDKLQDGATVIGLLAPYQFASLLPAFEKKGASAVSLELVPRITRAQSMDVLSSQANLGGYRAVIEAATTYGRAMPMMMTAAGTIAPAKVFVMGAGVAGLQAIATARRLGAVVSATDVRMAAKEQVESLGATFVMVENDETKQSETKGGYAKEMSDDYKRQQAALVSETIKKQDIVITTALIPGRPAPVLLSEDMVKTMKPGSVILDMAVEAGGNCPISEKDKVVEKHGVTIIGYSNLPSRIPVDASALYARNVFNVIALMFNKDKNAIDFNFEDEIVKGFTLTHKGKAVHPLLAPKKTEAKTEAKAEDKAVPTVNGDTAKSSFKRKSAKEEG